MGKDPDELRAEIAETRERMGDTADAIAYKADVPHRMQDAVGEKMDQMKSAVTGTVGQARRAMSRAGDAANDAMSRASDAMPDTGEIQANTMNAMRSVRENPLGLFFGMAAVGFVIGSLLPRTQLEDDQLVPMVDQLKERAKTQVRDTIETARDAAVSSISNSMGSNNV